MQAQAWQECSLLRLLCSIFLRFRRDAGCIGPQSHSGSLWRRHATFGCWIYSLGPENDTNYTVGFILMSLSGPSIFNCTMSFGNLAASPEVRHPAKNIQKQPLRLYVNIISRSSNQQLYTHLIYSFIYWYFFILFVYIFVILCLITLLYAWKVLFMLSHFIWTQAPVLKLIFGKTGRLRYFNNTYNTNKS